MGTQQRPFFDKQTTLIIKGIALIIMFLHHFFTAPGLWEGYFSCEFLEKATMYIFPASKICVPIFCFLTGYSYYFNSEKNLRYSLRKITDLFINYIVVFFVFALMAKIIVDYRYNFSDFLLELFALRRYTMVFCWYVYFYYITMLLLPFICKYYFSGNIFIDLFKVVLGIPFIISILNYIVILVLGDDSVVVEVICNLVFLVPVVTGYMFAKYELFEKLDYYTNKKTYIKFSNIIIFTLIAIVSPFGKLLLPCIEIPVGIIDKTLQISLDFIYAPIFIYSIIKVNNLIERNKFSVILEIIGKYSLLMWFAHCVFYNNLSSVFKPILYYPKSPLLITVWGIVLCLVFSVAVNKITKKIISIKNKILFNS